MDRAAKVNALDLEAGQIEAIELDLGVPLNRWDSAPSTVAVLVAIRAAATGEDPAELRRLKLPELSKLVSLGPVKPTGKAPASLEGADPEG